MRLFAFRHPYIAFTLTTVAALCILGLSVIALIPSN